MSAGSYQSKAESHRKFSILSGVCIDSYMWYLYFSSWNNNGIKTSFVSQGTCWFLTTELKSGTFADASKHHTFRHLGDSDIDNLYITKCNFYM